MSGSSRSRPKRKLEPISLEELAGTTGMSGFGTLFTRDLSQNVPVLDELASFRGASSAPVTETSALASAAGEPGAPDMSADVMSAPGHVVALGPFLAEATLGRPSALLSSAHGVPAPKGSALDLTAHASSALKPINVDIPGYRLPKIRAAATVEEGHSLAEQAIYHAMYRAGKPYRGEDRILTTGLRTLADRVRMAYANCKANVRSLIQKLAIEEYGQGFSYTTGRTYIIYSETEVLKRRRAAGLTHVIRTRGVAFVDPQTGVGLTRKPAVRKGAPKLSAPG